MTVKATTYFFLINEEQIGPYTDPQAKALWADARITSETLYWQEGMPEWMPVNYLFASDEEKPVVTDPVEEEPAAREWREWEIGVASVFIILVALIVFGVVSRNSFEVFEPETVSAGSFIENAAKSSVKEWVASRANDPSSVEYVEWGEPTPEGYGYLFKVRYRAKNGFGALVLEESVFVLDYSGQVVSMVPQGT